MNYAIVYRRNVTGYELAKQNRNQNTGVTLSCASKWINFDWVFQ